MEGRDNQRPRIASHTNPKARGNSAGDWGPSKPRAVPYFILAMRKRGHPESLIRRVVYENPLEFFGQSRNFQFIPPDAVGAT